MCPIKGLSTTIGAIVLSTFLTTVVADAPNVITLFEPAIQGVTGNTRWKHFPQILPPRENPPEVTLVGR